MRALPVLPAGLLDAGFASLATFTVSVWAGRSLSLAQFGSYGLFLSAFSLAAAVPAQLVLNPAENFSVARPVAQRLGVLSKTWHIGLPVALGAAVAAMTAAFLVALAADAPAGVRWPLALTALCCATVSPLQDHVRRCLHLGGVSWRAAAVSLVQLLGVITFLALLAGLNVAAIWRPFGALTLANVTSAAVGLARTRRDLRAVRLPPYRFGEIVRSGRWLLGMESANTAAVFITAALIAKLAGTETLGYAEAARLVAQPVLVLVAGLSAVLGPQLLEAGATRDSARSHRVTRYFIGLLLAAGLLYAAVTIVDWPINILAFLLPQAYDVPGLALASVAASVLVGVAFPYRSVLVGAGWERLLPAAAVLAGALQVLAAATAGVVGAFAQPLGVAVFGAVLSVAYRRHVRAALATAPPRAWPERHRVRKGQDDERGARSYPRGILDERGVRSPAAFFRFRRKAAGQDVDDVA
jgi:O-antigen/teichoic acid export membrane protein